MVTKNDISVLLISTHDTRVSAMFHLTKIGDLIGHPTWDPFDRSELKPYRALLGRNVGNIWGKFWAGSGTHMGNPHGTHMKQVNKNRMGPIWVAHMGPIYLPRWVPCGVMFCASWVHLKIDV